MAKQKVKLPRKGEAATVGTRSAGEQPAMVVEKRSAKAKTKPDRKSKRQTMADRSGQPVEAGSRKVPPKRKKGVRASRSSKPDGTLPSSPTARKRTRSPAMTAVAMFAGETGRLERLERALRDVQAGSLPSPRTRKLLDSGVPKMAQKVIEEAAEVAIEAIRGEHTTLIQESVDLFYNLLALWSASGVTLSDVWVEMDRREALLGLAEKLPKLPDEQN